MCAVCAINYYTVLLKNIKFPQCTRFSQKQFSPIMMRSFENTIKKDRGWNQQFSKGFFIPHAPNFLLLTPYSRTRFTSFLVHGRVRKYETAPETLYDILINCKKITVWVWRVRPTFIFHRKPLYSFLLVSFWSFFGEASANKHIYIRYGNTFGRMRGLTDKPNFF